ncbi:MAG: bile acid:sodium symporter family protein [Bacteriovoracaceae bacterium]
MDIDQVRLNLNQESLGFLKIIIAFIMFGVSLDLKLSDFKSIFKNPRGLIAGLLSQFVLFPIFTYLLITFYEVRPSIALALIMIAACPGGSMSNLMTSMAKGNVALSVGLTSISTLLSTLTTPFFLLLIGEKVSSVKLLLTEIQVNRSEMLEGVFLILGIPLTLGMLCARYYPGFAHKFQSSMNKIAMVILVVFVVGALTANYQHFLSFFHVILIAVLLHHLLALASGIIASKAMRLSTADTKAVIIEVSIKNSGLGLALVFQFFGGLGGMAMGVAWWGIWQVLTGVILLKFWQKKEIHNEKVLT